MSFEQKSPWVKESTWPLQINNSPLLFISPCSHGGTASSETETRQFLYKYNVTRTKEQVMNLRSGGDIKRAEGRNREEI